MRVNLRGRVALVTGGGRGIGAAVARRLAEAGADVIIGCRARRADAEAVAGEVQALGVRAVVAQADLTDAAETERVIGDAARGLGGLDIVVANAGTWPPEAIPVAAMTTARWRSTLAANLDAVFLTVRTVLPLMRDGGSVVIVSSTAGQRGEALHADYAAAKGALISFTKSVAVETAPRLTVNCVAPGWVDTEMAAPAWVGDARARVEQSIPLGRVATADDVAAPIVFLASPLARHITGEVLNVNGGSVLCG